MDYVCNSLKQIWEKEKLVQKGYKNEDFFTIIYPKISINVVKTMSPWENPQQLPSAKMNFEDCGLICSIQNWKFLGSNPTRCLTWLWDPT